MYTYRDCILKSKAGSRSSKKNANKWTCFDKREWGRK